MAFRNEKLVDLSGIALDLLSNSKEGWMKFFAEKATDNSAVVLNMRNSRFNIMNVDELATLLDAINESHVVKLDISENMFFLTFDNKKLVLLFGKLFQSQIENLNLAKTGIVSAGLEVLTYINSHIKESKLQELNLGGNDIQNMTDEELELLFSVIRNSNIHHIDLSGNNFKYLNDNQFKIISTNIARSRVVSAKLDDCKFSYAHKSALEEILRQNANRVIAQESAAATIEYKPGNPSSKAAVEDEDNKTVTFNHPKDSPIKNADDTLSVLSVIPEVSPVELSHNTDFSSASTSLPADMTTKKRM